MVNIDRFLREHSVDPNFEWGFQDAHIRVACEQALISLPSPVPTPRGVQWGMP